MPEEIKKRGRPKKNTGEKTIVKRPVKDGPPVQPEKWDGRFKSVEPMRNQKRARQTAYKWNHHATINWIMGQADPVGFLSQVMQGKEIFPVYSDDGGELSTVGKISADPELRVMAAKTLLGKCVPDLKAVEINASVETTKVVDISKLTGEDLNAIERVLEHAVTDGSSSREDEEIIEGVHQELLGND